MAKDANVSSSKSQAVVLLMYEDPAIFAIQSTDRFYDPNSLHERSYSMMKRCRSVRDRQKTGRKDWSYFPAIVLALSHSLSFESEIFKSYGLKRPSII